MPEVFRKNEDGSLVKTAGSTPVTREEDRRGDRSAVTSEPPVVSEEDLRGDAVVLDEDLEAQVDAPASKPAAKKSSSSSSDDK